MLVGHAAPTLHSAGPLHPGSTEPGARSFLLQSFILWRGYLNGASLMNAVFHLTKKTHKENKWVVLALFLNMLINYHLSLN